MEKIKKTNELLENVFSSGKNFVIFPFSLIGLVFIGLFYLFSPFYMLAELFVRELNSILKADSENDSNGAQIVKNLIGFGLVVAFNFLRAVLLLPLATGYFIASISFVISSIGRLRVNPFKFSERASN
jgi:hypothetical protein